MLDGKAIAEQLLEGVKAYVEGVRVSLSDTMATEVRDPVFARLEAQDKRLEQVKNGEPGAPGPPGEPGKGVTLDDLLPHFQTWAADTERGLRAQADDFLKAIPKPQDGANGKDGADGQAVTLEDLRPLIENAVTRAALEFERRAQDLLQRSIDRLPKPENGKDGRDGLSFEDFDMTHDGARTFEFKFVRGELVKTFIFKVPALLEQGIYKAGQTYERGDGVTYGGHYWIAQKDTQAMPAENNADWRLAVRRGRAGKDGERGEKGDPGSKGKDGRDLTQMAFNGAKY